jgi:hypothetical protein
MSRRFGGNSWALTSAAAFLGLFVAVVLAGCNDATESALERLDVNATPAAERLSAAEFRDLSIPEQTDVLLRFYEIDRTAECPNVEYEGGTSDLYEGVRSDSLNVPDERPMSELLIEHCSEGGTE